MIKGVNLGGWLVLEKWLTPEVFVNTSAEDEQALYEELTKVEIENRLKKHRDSFITEEDFRFISDSKCELIRLPIPYTILGHDKQREQCIAYVDQAFAWAKTYNLKILLDLHTVPGSQNGLDNGGVCGLCTWHMQEENIEVTMDVLIALVKRYGELDALFGIEPVNEPIDEKTFKGIMYSMDKRYHERILKSEPVPTDVLKAFYKRVYTELNPWLKKQQKIIFHDGFRLSKWNDFMPQDQYPNVWFDTHMYLNFAKYELHEQNTSNYIAYIYDVFIPALQGAKKYHPILVGEWSIAHTPKDCRAMSEEMQNHYYRASSSLQEMAFEHAYGWIYFNYKVNDKNRFLWDFNNVVKKKLLNL